MLSKIDFGNGLGRWNTNAYAAADFGHVRVENIFPVQRDLAVHPGVAQGLVDAVQASQKGGFASIPRGRSAR